MSAPAGARADRWCRESRKAATWFHVTRSRAPRATVRLRAAPLRRRERADDPAHRPVERVDGPSDLRRAVLHAQKTAAAEDVDALNQRGQRERRVRRSRTLA